MGPHSPNPLEARPASTPAMEDVIRPELRSRVRVTAGGCWEWTGCISDGYGQAYVGGVHYRVHRLTYADAKGEIPPGLVLDHLCRNRACVNPDHLEAVTDKINFERGEGAAGLAIGVALQRNKTHCPQGHAYAGDNLYIHGTTGARICKACRIADQREYRAKAKASSANPRIRIKQEVVASRRAKVEG